MKRKRLLVLSLLFALLPSVQTSSLMAQGNKAKMLMETSGQPLIKVLRLIEDTFSMKIIYSFDDLQDLSVRNKIKANTLEEALKQALDGLPVTYSIKGKYVTIKVNKLPVAKETAGSRKITITGKVVDEQGEGVPAATIVVRGSGGKGTLTDMDGQFTLQLEEGKGETLDVSFIGMVNTSYYVNGRKDMGGVVIAMKEDRQSLDEVVVNGYFTKNKSSFTGNAVMVGKDDLQKISTNNIMQALQVYDPSFRLQEDLNSGSNPNAMPHIRLRGDSGLGSAFTETTLKNDPNMPTFIMDGYEVTAEKVYDLNMDRVESITILKDASATAIYGSRAANGVVVITTKVPETGRLRINYSFNGVLQTPDLTDYNIMNAAEKLEVERLSGRYESGDPYSQQLADMDYALRLSNVKRGVDTYWLSQPIQTILGHKHTLYLEGGDERFRFGVDVNYQDNPGVIKKSSRNRYGLGFKLQYNHNNKILFRNDISVNRVSSKESPYGSYSDYANTNPYWPTHDEEGNLIKSYTQYVNYTYKLLNPLYEATLNHRNETQYTEVTDNFDFDWFITEALRLKGRVSYTMRNDHTYRFIDPNSSRYSSYDYQEGDGVTNKGEAYNYDGRSHNLDANLLLTFNKAFGKHYVNAAIGGNLQEEKYENTSFSVRGFPSGNMDYISFGKEFVGTSPDGSEGVSRLCGAFANISYTWDNIYLLDFSGRIDGSSSFGREARFAPFYSVGLGWNVHKEKFFNIRDIMNHLKLTCNFGELGKSSFSPYEAQNMYTYYKGTYYAGGLGAIVTVLGNEDLKWEKTRSLDANLEMGFLKDRISARFTYYKKLTNGLLADITLPQSNGFTYFRDNVGKLENSGYEIYMRAFLWRSKDLTVSVFASMAHNKNVIKEISNSLKARNEKIDYDQDNYEPEYGERYTTAKPQAQFKEGESTTTIYAVRSLGINPMNGKEVYLDRYGNATFIWSAADKVACGDTEPTASGSFGLNSDWKGFNLNMSFLYQWGGQIYNQTLVDRVENADLRYNADRRILTQRWQKPGDIAMFKDIKDNTRTNLTSRMVQDNNVLQFKSLSLSYTLPKEFSRKWYMDRLKLTFQVEDLFYWSSVKRERGLDYPYTHAFNFGLQAQF